MVERLEVLRDVHTNRLFLRIGAQGDQCFRCAGGRTEDIGVGCYVGGIGIVSLRCIVSIVLCLHEKPLISSETKYYLPLDSPRLYTTRAYFLAARLRHMSAQAGA